MQVQNVVLPKEPSKRSGQAPGMGRLALGVMSLPSAL